MLVNAFGQLDLLIPKKSLCQLEDLLDRDLKRDAESAVEISDTGNQLCFAFGSRTLFSRKLSGTFPNYEMVCLGNWIMRRKSARKIFANHFRGLTLTSETKNHSVTMEIQAGKLLLRAGTGEAEAQEEMMAVLNGESAQNVHSLSFNSRYVQDFLHAVSRAGTPTFSLGFNDGNSLFELSLPDEREGFRCVLMLLRS